MTELSSVILIYNNYKVISTRSSNVKDKKALVLDLDAKINEKLR